MNSSLDGPFCHLTAGVYFIPTELLIGVTTSIG